MVRSTSSLLITTINVRSDVLWNQHCDFSQSNHQKHIITLNMHAVQYSRLRLIYRQMFHYHFEFFRKGIHIYRPHIIHRDRRRIYVYEVTSCSWVLTDYTYLGRTILRLVLVLNMKHLFYWIEIFMGNVTHSFLWNKLLNNTIFDQFWE